MLGHGLLHGDRSLNSEARWHGCFETLGNLRYTFQLKNPEYWPPIVLGHLSYIRFPIAFSINVHSQRDHKSVLSMISSSIGVVGVCTLSVIFLALFRDFRVDSISVFRLGLAGILLCQTKRVGVLNTRIGLIVCIFFRQQSRIFRDISFLHLFHSLYPFFIIVEEGSRVRHRLRTERLM